MVFSFEMVAKINSDSKYKVGGCLAPEFNDKELFIQVKDAYNEIFTKESIDLKSHMIIKDDYILFSDFDIVVISNILKILSNNLGFEIKSVVKDDCRFIPSSCEPLFKMEIHRLFS